MELIKSWFIDGLLKESKMEAKERQYEFLSK